MAGPLNHVSIAGPRNGTTSHTYDPSSATNVIAGTPFTPTAGNLLVVLGGGGVTATTPTGWTLPTNGSAVASNGVYCWHRTAAGGDTFSTTHNASNWEFVVDIYEFPAGSTFNKAASATGISSGSGGANLTGLSGTNFNATAMAINHLDLTGRSVTWSAPAVEQCEYASGASGGINGLSFSTAAVTDDTATSRQMTATHTGGSVADMVAFSVAVFDPDAPVAIPCSLVAAGAVWTSTATTLPNPISPAYPAGIQQDDHLYLAIVLKPNTATVTTPTDWSLVSTSGSLAGGTAGAGTGPLQIHLYERDVPSGGLSGTLSVTLAGSPSSAVAQMFAFRPDLTGGYTTPTWSEATTQYSRTTSSTTYGGTGAANIGLSAGDYLLYVSAASDDQPTTHFSTGPTFGATGATVGTVTTHGYGATSSGNDVSMHAATAPITAGAETAAPSSTHTGSVAETGGSMFVRVRAMAVAGATPITASPSGISSEEAFGSPAAVDNSVIPTGIPSGTTFGTPTATIATPPGMHSIGLPNPTSNFAAVFNDNAGSITVANSFRTSETGWVSNGAKFYFSAAWISANCGNVTLVMQGGTPGAVDTATGARLASATAVQPASAGWVEVTWAAPVDMTANAKYWIGAYSAAGHYTGYSPVAGMSFLATAYQLQAADGSNLWIGAQNTTEDEAEFQYATSAPGWITSPSTSGLFWGVDIVAGAPTAGDPITASPTGIASAETFGTAAAGIAGGPATPTGIASGAAFGTPTALTILSVAQENALTSGVAQRTSWHDGADQTSMPAFARSSYYTPGQTAQFSVDYNAAFTAEVWRIGWYNGGTAARKVADLTGTPTNQPAATTIANSNGAITCEGWSVNLTWAIPATATPGVYWLRLNGSGVSSQLVFVVSDKNSKRPVLMVLSEATWHGAYNYYGGKTAVLTGKSLYGSSGPMVGGIENRSLCVSYDRPVVTRDGIQQTYAMTDNIPTARFLERMGIDVGYTTCEQIDADPSILDGRALVISSGHNEYISQTIYDKFKAISAAGTNLINMGGNDFFWRTRYGTNDRADTATRGRVMWCYKDTMTGPGAHVAGTPLVSAADWGGTWQDTRWTLREETGALWGDRFIANGVRLDPLTVPFAYKGKPIWRNCASVQALTSGQSFAFGAGSLGMEWDKPHPTASFGPPRVALSATTITLSSNASDVNGENYNLTETPTHSIIMAKTPGGGYVCNWSTCFFPFTFDDFHDYSSQQIANANGRQAMLNVLVDLGAVPNSTSVSAASLTLPTAVSNVESDYGIPAVAVPTGIGPVEAFGSPTASMRVTATRATTWDTLSTRTATRASTWDVLTALAAPATRATTWRALAARTATRASTFDVLAARTSSRATTWTVKARLTATRDVLFDTLSRLTGSRSTTWNVDATGQVTATRSSTWRVLQGVASSRGTLWDTLSRLTSSRATPWDTLSRLTSTRATSWNTDATGQVTATRGTTWRVLTRLTGSRGTLWDTLSRLSAPSARAATWRTLSRLTDTADTTYRVLQRLTVTRSSQWAVVDAPGTVTATRGTSWAVAARLTFTRDTQWDVLRAMAAPATRGTTWDVLRPLPAPATRTTTYRVLAPRTATRGTTWTAKARTTATQPTQWDVLVRISAAATRPTQWAVLRSAGTVTRVTTWGISGQITATRNTTWDVEQPPAQPLRILDFYGPYTGKADLSGPIPSLGTVTMETAVSD